MVQMESLDKEESMRHHMTWSRIHLGGVLEMSTTCEHMPWPELHSRRPSCCPI